MSTKKILIIGTTGVKTDVTAQALNDGIIVLPEDAKRLEITVESIKINDERKYYERERVLQSHLSQCLPKQGGRKQKKRYPNI